MITRTHRFRGRLLAIFGLAAVGVLMAALPAYADTSQSSASAVTLQLVGQTAVTSGTVTASNNGTTETITGTNSPALSVLGTQNIIRAGVLAQQARAFSDGSSAACAGLVGVGGTIQVGEGGSCQVSGNPPSGVNLLGVITADAILTRCVANSDGTATATTQIVNARLLGIPINLTLPNINVPGVANVTVGQQTIQGTNGQVSGTAFHLSALSILGPPLAQLDIGHVSCGPNARTNPIPTFPLKGLPIAGGIVALAGGAVYYRRRRTASKAVA